MNKISVRIQLRDGAKRSWHNVAKIMNQWLIENGKPKLDLRKASKTNIPLAIENKCCKSKLEIRRIKDFPLKDRKCKCGNYLIKWQ